MRRVVVIDVPPGVLKIMLAALAIGTAALGLAGTALGLCLQH